jgi:microcystin degradation protein MlrC
MARGGRQGRRSQVRIAVGGIIHESNTFSRVPTDLDSFRVTTGDDLVTRWRGTHHEMGGFLDGAQAAGYDIVPTLMASATPSGPVTAATRDALVGGLLDGLLAGSRVDGLLLALHGALVTDDEPEGDAGILRRVRAAVGPDLPIVVTHDFHCNICPELVENATALVVYRTNPHTDQHERGLQAAELIGQVVRGEVRPVMALAQPPMLFTNLRQRTAAEPLASIQSAARSMEFRPGVLVANTAAGYQYADVRCAGVSAVVVADSDAALARSLADELAMLFWKARDQLQIDFPDADAAVRRALDEGLVPTVIVETGDNIGGGSPGDSTFLLAALLRQHASDAVVTICDPAAAAAAATAGIGGAFAMAVGGKTDQLHGEPVAVTGRVRSLHDGRYEEHEVRHGGNRFFDQGLTAVVELDGPITLVLNSRPAPPVSLHQIVSLGIVPQRQKILVVKSGVSHRAAYDSFAARTIEADTPGITAADPRRFTYERVRRPVWPLDTLLDP